MDDKSLLKWLVLTRLLVAGLGRLLTSFGNITAQSNATKQPLFAFTGLMFDEDSELQYSRARWYDPSVGRFLSEDPIGFAAGDFNVQRYVSNSPLNFTDPSGLFAVVPAGSETTKLMQEWWQKQQASTPAGGGGGSFVNWYGNAANGLTGGFYGWAGDALYGGGSAIGMSDDTMAKMKDWHLVAGTAAVSTAIVLGGEYVIGGTVGTELVVGAASAGTAVLGRMAAWWTALGKSSLTIGLGGGGMSLGGGGTLALTSGLTVTIPGTVLQGATAVTAAGTTMMMMQSYWEIHHNLPREYEEDFNASGLDIEDYTSLMTKAGHRLKPNGFHTGPNSWNKLWGQFWDKMKGTIPSSDEVLAELDRIRSIWGLPPFGS